MVTQIKKIIIAVSYTNNRTYKPAKKQDTLYEMSDNERKGFEFEKFVDSHFSSAYFKRMEWRSDIKGQNGRLSESSKYPDLEYKIISSDICFAVECKWRSHFYNDHVQILKSEQQLNNYREYSYDRNLDVVLVLGVGGRPDMPDRLYSIPLCVINAIEYSASQLEPYRFRSVPESFIYDTRFHNLKLFN